MKKFMVYFNYRKGSIYIHLDGLLFDLKYDPSVIEIPVPRYFKEDDHIPIDIKFTKKVERDGKKKTLKGKKKSAKGKKKKAEAEQEDKKVFSLEEKETKIDSILSEFFKTDEPVAELTHDPFSMDLGIMSAIRMIQRNERGRQGRERYFLALDRYNQQVRMQNNKKNLHQGKLTKNDGAEQQSCEMIQKTIKGILARLEIEKLRKDEMIFLGMERAPKTEKQIEEDPIT